MFEGYHKDGFEGTVEPSQMLGMNLLVVLVEPTLYQAFLQISTNYCYPFGHQRHHVPVQWMIDDLVQNIHQMDFFVSSKSGGSKFMTAPVAPLVHPKGRRMAYG